MRLMLVFNKRLDIDRIPQRLGSEARIIHDFVGRAVPLRSRKRQVLGQGAVWLNRDHPRSPGASLRMPYNQLVGTRRDIVDSVRSITIRQSVVGIVYGHGPTFHVSMKAA